LGFDALKTTPDPTKVVTEAALWAAVKEQGLTDSRSRKNSRHALEAQFRQSVFGRVAGYEDVNDADRLGHDAAIRWVVGGRATRATAASTSQMGRFETQVLTRQDNLDALNSFPALASS
jgi:hypothetical protein